MWRRHIAITAASVTTLALALWLRNPLLPYGDATPRASTTAPDTPETREARNRRAAIHEAARAVRDLHRGLAEVATASLESPAGSEPAFDFLRRLPLPDEAGVLVTDGGTPVAWAGQIRTVPETVASGTTVVFTPFYVSLQVTAARGTRKAIAVGLLHAESPANRIASALDERLDASALVNAFHFAPLSDTSAAGDTIVAADGHPLVRLDATPISAESLQFASTANARARGAALLSILLVLLLTVGWSSRRSITSRLATLAVSLAAIALVPWNNFSNFSRVFDPAFYYAPLAGPFTANSGIFAMFASLLLLGVIALIRARRMPLPRMVAGALSASLLIGGAVFVNRASRGIVLPPWGATMSLWVTWQMPLFLILFAAVLAATWLIRVSTGGTPMVTLRLAATLALACGVLATFSVWTRTTEQRLQLAMRDVAGLQSVDGDAAQLLARFGRDLATREEAGDRADLLKRYAESDLAPARLQVSLGSWNSDGLPDSRLDLAPVQFDMSVLSAVTAEAIASGEPVIRQVLGPAGRQVMLAAPHDNGEATTVVASPRTRVVAQNPYAQLLGFDLPDKTEPPYTLTLADSPPGRGAMRDLMTWRRVGDEWHGDEVIETSLGSTRAHVEVDLRSWPTRLVRAALLVMLNVAVAGLIWAVGTMSEDGFFRWLRGRTMRWVRSYHGRLTLALFTFFVVPAVGFAFWSYQRLQRDDRGVRELLIRDVLNSATARDPAQFASRNADATAPVFLFADGLLSASSDSLYEMIAPGGRLLSRRAFTSIALHGELTATSRLTIAGSTMFWGYRSVPGAGSVNHVLAAPARSDELVLDRRRRDLTILVLFATALGALAAFWLSGIAARILARDLELSRIEVGRAERVLAWGEMARQVAHEIKNPLTPIRLGVQHLRRARADSRIDFDRVLEENVTRILSEIDRLDKIARAFSRYGSAPDELPPAESVDVAVILRDVIGLERMGVGGVEWTLKGGGASVPVIARRDELHDVLLNVFENARLARARRVMVKLTVDDANAHIAIDDDGAGISSASLPRVFEPHFSTRTTGSGLGLAISRRLLESWGGTIDLQSEAGRGARVIITLKRAAV